MTIFDRIRTTTTQTGTLSTISVGATPPSGFQKPSARFSVNDADIPVVVAHQTADEWQVCWCTYSSADTFTVNSVIYSSNSDNAVNFSAGTKDVFVVNSSASVGGLREVNTWTKNQIFQNTGLKVLDTNASHTLTIAPGSNLTADRTLTITTGDAARTLTLNGDTTLTGTNSGDQTITLTGDVTGSGTGSFAATLANTAVTPAGYGSATQVGTFTVDAKGRLTAASNTNIALAASAITSGTLDAGLLPAFTGGDVTSSAGSANLQIAAGAVGTTEIANDAVTYAKIQNVSATDRILGRSSSGAGDIEEITCTAAGRALIDDADASAQRTTLGLAIGTNVQAYDADLAALAGISTNGVLARTGAGTAAARTIEGTANEIDVANKDGVSGNPTLSLPTALTFTGKTITGGTLTGITDLALADGGTGASLTDPNADRIMFWDDSGGAVTWLEPTGRVAISGTTINTVSDAQTFDTVAAVNSATIAASVNHIRTAGYHSNGDGGGALYKRVASGAAGIGTGRITSNGGAIIWELTDKEPNVRQFGAYGNNTNDDATAINNAIAWLGSSGGTLGFPPGNYRVESAINANVPVILRGTGTSGSVYQPNQSSSAAITWAGSSGGDVVKFGGFGTLISGGGIIGLKIDGIASAANGLRIKDVQRAYFRDVTITGATVNGLLMENSTSSGTFDPTGFCTFDDLRIMLRGGATNNARGIYVNGSGTGVEGVTLCTFRRCRIDHANAAAIEVSSIGDFFYWESLQTFRADVETGVGVWFSSTSSAAVCGGHQFYGCNVSAGYRFDLANIHYQTRIVNTGHIDVNSGTAQLFGRGSGDVTVVTSLGFAYGQALLEPLHVYKRRDNCALIRHDTTNGVLHTADGNWKTDTTTGGTITENGQLGSGLNLTTGGTANDICAFYDNATIGGGDGFAIYSFAGSFLVAPVSDADVVVRLGWANGTGATPTNGIYVEYDPSVSANWRLICTKAGTTTAVTSTVAVQVLAKQEIYIFVEPDSNGVSAYFRSANNKLFSLIATTTTNVPIVAISTMCYIRTKAAATKRVDIYGVKVGTLDEV